jgi:hypothetical protein
MVGQKLLWTGFTIITVSSVFKVPAAIIVGSVLMVIGLVLFWFDK